jgi:TonB family protein
VWYGTETLRIIILFADPARAADAQARFGDMGIGAVSAMLSTRLTLLALAGLTLTWILIAIGLRCMEVGRPKRWDAVISGVLAVTVLGWTAASTSSIRTDIHSFRKSAEALATTVQEPPDFSAPPDAPESRGSTSTRENPFEGLPPPPPPPPGPETGRYRVGGTIPQPRKIKDVKPVYPAIAQKARVQGVVIVEASIDPAGMVSDVRILRSIPLLDQAAVDAVKQWQFEPTTVDGVAVTVVMTVTVNFTLSD